MKKALSILVCITLFFSCNNKEKLEHELLLKEQELLKREQELNAKHHELDSLAEEMTQNNLVESATNPKVDISKDSKKKSNDWRTFHNKLGYQIDLPSYFSDGGITNSGLNYYVNDVNDNVSISVYAFEPSTMEYLSDVYNQTLRSTRNITYNILKENWFVVSGYRKEEIYYQKTIQKNGLFYTLSIHYPMDLASTFDGLLPRISKSFQ